MLCEPIEEIEEVSVHANDPTKVVKIGKNIAPTIKAELITLL